MGIRKLERLKSEALTLEDAWNSIGILAGNKSAVEHKEVACLLQRAIYDAEIGEPEKALRDLEEVQESLDAVNAGKYHPIPNDVINKTISYAFGRKCEKSIEIAGNYRNAKQHINAESKLDEAMYYVELVNSSAVRWYIKARVFETSPRYFFRKMKENWIDAFRRL